MSAESIIVLILGVLFFGGIGFLIWASRGNAAAKSDREERRLEEGDRIVPPAGRQLHRAGRGRG